MAALDERMATLPPQLQMFLRGCPPELEAKRHRIDRREIVMRNLLALAAGVRRPVCWKQAPDIPGYQNPLSVMDLLFGKFTLMDDEDGAARRAGRGPLLVVWRQRDSFHGEDHPPAAFASPWPAAAASAVDALGRPQPAEVADGRVHVQVSLAPLFIAAD
jgi:hypothetical protein